jgi:hypothetical protein
MRLVASLALLAAIAIIGCSTASAQTSDAERLRPLCEFSGLTPASPEWPGCLKSMATNPDRDLLEAVIKARHDAEASGAPDIRAEFAKRTVAIDAETYRRMIARRAQAASTGSADCGAWHWDTKSVACQP